MKLSEYRVPTETIELPGGSVALRGLGLEDIIILVRRHKDVLDRAFTVFAAKEAADLDGIAVRDLSQELIQLAPQAAAEIIALAADEPGAADLARQLPFAVQLDAIEKIGRLTFAQEGGVKKVMETVNRAVRGLNLLPHNDLA